MQISIWNDLSPAQKQAVLTRPTFADSENLLAQVKTIINVVQTGGDKALIELTAKFDKADLATLNATPAEFIEAQQQIKPASKQAIEFAKQQIERYHAKQLSPAVTVETCPGVICERQMRPIDRVGLYIPGGTAPLISTILMLGVPAQLANCPVRVLCTPPNAQGNIDPHILFAAQLCGISDVYKVGGAQAIAAMAYGTQSIAKVDKIFGPGNAWVTAAKLLVTQDPAGSAIDLPAGPSEILVIADENANPEFVASDLLSQAEHGTDSQVIFVTTCSKMADAVNTAVYKQLETLSRQTIATASLANSRIIIVKDLQQAIEVSNIYAPEHLSLQVDEPEKYKTQIKNAGAVFLGKWAAETVGDYVTGANHVLPTYGYAKKYSGLGVMDFMKAICFESVTREGLERIGPFAEIIADLEGLDAHKRAVSLRLAK